MAEPLDEQTIRRYLLGELPEAERDAAAARIFESDDSFDKARELEDDLVDALAIGELSGAEASKVRAFLAESSQTDRLAAARVLARGQRAQVKGPAMVRTFIGLAAAILVILATSVYMVRNRAPVEIAQAPQPAVQAPRATAIFTFLAPAGATRSNAAAFSVRIPPGTQLVQIQVEIEAGFPAYEVVLRTTSGRGVITVTATKPGRFEVPLAASLLPQGKYEIEVAGMRGWQRELLQYHYFNVE